ncbi:Ankyrin repeat and SOCS box protein 10 [Collichthys lucidus]|uniref:Ankyrin repeat and SOCS box protein 10 n=1 Tax=Collichthys lucidus TaxID=240159 RepID=A0A4U5UX65_COLLU|nr:Ankyrin repeat and SOCS box protein 10 [Collichthys lucidus]
MALRSLELDEDMLRRHKYKKQLTVHHLNSYMLKKEGDLEAMQRLFPRGSTASLIIEPQGGDMRWVATGEGCVLQFWNSLLVGDDLTILSIVDDDEYEYLIDAIYDTSNMEEWKNFRFNYRCLRLWSLTYEQELTTPLHITASRGFADCLRLLLQRGADVDLAPGGTTALHESCESCQPECTKLLLVHGANANAVSEDGLMPLHVCTSPESFECAKYLLQYGAAINGRSIEEEDTPLHVAARNGLPDHTELYLRYGAAVDKKNYEGVTPLNAACSQRQEAEELQRYFKVCQILTGAGADIHITDQDKHSPLHMACKNANPDVVDLLLANGACVNDMDYGGEAPMHNILKVVCFKVPHQPERIVRALLNHGSIRVWPGALPVEHKDFFESVFSLALTPRSLQHLARCKVRDFLKERVHKVVPKLQLPTFIRNYLLLEYRGFIH